MSISLELRDRYSSEVDVDWWEGLVLTHSQFTRGYYLNNGPRRVSLPGKVDGIAHDFEPFPFEVVLPQRDSAGRSDMRVMIGAVGTQINKEMNLAIKNPTERISARYTVYLYGSSAPQYDPPISFSLTDVTVTNTQIECLARTVDTLNAAFPRNIYRTIDFPGLLRR